MGSALVSENLFHSVGKSNFIEKYRINCKMCVKLIELSKLDQMCKEGEWKWFVVALYGKNFKFGEWDLCTQTLWNTNLEISSPA